MLLNKYEKCVFLILLCLSILLLIASISNMTVTTFAYSAKPVNGDGLSAETAYEISSPENLVWLAEVVNADNAEYNDKYYKLADSLPETGLDVSVCGNWDPIGKFESGGSENNRAFKGVFDGNNKKITGIYIYNSDLRNGGVFGYILDGSIKNLGVSGTVSGLADLGGIVGYSRNSTITNCYFTGSVIGSSYDIGGIAGHTSDSKIINCYFSGNVVGTYNIGGIVGSYYGDSIANSYVNGSVTGIETIGGIAGFAIGEILNCYSAGNVVGQWAGGIAGSTNNADIINCYSTSEVSGTGMYYGGIVGDILSSKITNCAALNSKVTGMRIYGNANGVIVKGTRAFSSIVNNSESTLWEDFNVEMNAENALTADFWKTEINWYNSAWSESIWKFEDGKLPVLKNTRGIQNGEPPLHLTVRDIQTGVVKIEQNSDVYTGNSIEITIKVILDGIILTQNKDYEYSIVSSDDPVLNKSAGISAGEVTILFRGLTNFKNTKYEMYNIKKADNNGSITMESYIYNTSRNPLVVDVPLDYDGSVLNYYKLKGESDSSYVLDKPVNAGQYSVKAIFSETVNYNMQISTADFEIRKAVWSIAVTMESIIYGETLENPSVSNLPLGYDGDIIYYYKLKGESDSSYVLDKPVNAGEYIIRATFPDVANYQMAETADFEIRKAVWSIAVTMESIIYGERLENPSVSNLPLGYDGDIIYYYKLKGESDSSYVLDKPVNAGEYKIRATFPDTANYQMVETTDFEIRKNAGKNVTITDLSLITSESVTVSAINISTNSQIIEYAINTFDIVPLEGWQTEFTFDGLKANTKYYIFFRTKANDNFNSGEVVRLKIKTKMSGGMIAGIIIGSACFLGLGVFAAYFFMIKKKI